MITQIFELAKVVDFFFPKELKNVRVDFQVKELNLYFVCDDKGIGYFRVFIYDDNQQFVAYIEGENYEGSHINIGQNINHYSQQFLFNCFHMSRCRREFERLGDIGYSKGFDYFRKQAIVSDTKSVD